jgi:peptidoglycan biosynthesis protein MviN/MurJ (putative lipid II flippase)
VGLGTTVSVRLVAIAVTAGAGLQVLVAAVSLARHLRVPRWGAIIAASPAMWVVAGPLLVYNLLSYANLILERAIASTLGTGTVAEFGYATRAFSLLGTFALTPVAMVFLPRFSRIYGSAHAPAYLHTWLIRITVMGGLATACFIGGGEALVALIYGHGRFAGPAVSATYQLLAIYALGAVATSTANLLVAAASAARVARLAAFAAAVDLVLYAVLAIALSRQAGAAGLAFARVVSFWVVLAIIAISARRQLTLRLWRLALFAAGCTVVALAAAYVPAAIERILHGPGFPSMKMLFVRGLVSAGAYSLAMGTARFLAARTRRPQVSA